MTKIPPPYVGGLERPQTLTWYANQIKKLGQMEGATVQVALAQIGGAQLFLAGINSSADWTSKQLQQLEDWNIVAVPRLYEGGRMTLKLHGGAPHAEENMACHIDERGGRGIRWSRAVVGDGFKDRVRGSSSYVCRNCQLLIGRIGGYIEPPF